MVFRVRDLNHCVADVMTELVLYGVMGNLDQ